ncbi:LysM peptidoglycan-binding domain-containing protein [Mesorhizobium sp. M1E.F.Ca.ET.045.02.1.1]|uniref:LysM peptidoglycan-binding domain-containing protein n=1 Tax=Mesorhizobium sp. M1E.F.Ca.ET.045.02.1.1 TaxID=2493672 RepID=UPI000F75D769|nr:LysM peptidoglycan-binding domain-containing protein [Mesorhizobium sp. M1E.F.Ca.ET.045.02.1.1]AZO22752.1 LysM peptidoglycan-binding domain-containing protein [Mesorhizobium sp. M1E.F.Ca.ET.045.02.1.1]
MVRPITPAKPPVQPQKVDAKANAAQIARLEAQAAQLREQIRLANRMGERDWAAQARQQLSQVNTELSSLQPPPPAVVPTAPNLQIVNASTGTSGNGTTVVPALYQQPDLLGPTVTPVKLDGGTPEDNAAEAATARNIVNDVTGGKSIDQIASARGMTREQVIAALRSGGMTVSTTDPTSGNGDVQTTKITDASGRTVTQYYDYQHDSYYTSVQQQPNGAATTSPVRDGLGRKETSSYNSDTGAITTRYEDDLGTGTVTERTSLPNGASVETVTPGQGPSLPVTTVTGPDGRKTILAYSQDPGGTTTKDIKHDLADGKSIDQIAKENGLTNEQVIAELQAAGYQVTTQQATSDNGDVQSVQIVDPHTGDKTVYSYDYQHDERTVVTTADGKETSQSVDGNGGTRNSVRNTKTGETTTTIVDPKTGTETKIVTDKDGRVTTTTTEKINGGKPVEYEVKPNDNLTLIARKYGVSLDDLRRTNPDLFGSSRNPNIIHTGEKITIENGTRTTVEVTFNGYTLTTKPDGSMTLHNDTTGSDLKIEVGTAQQALAELLLAINPQSKDPEQAKTDTVLKTTLEGVLGGASPELAQEAADKQQAVKDAIKKYGGGKPATPNLDGSATSVGPFGEPPSATAPSGGKWVPLMVDGSWQWFDPEVAKAIAAENAVIARLGEAQAKPEQSGAQLDVYALDPEYKGAMKSAETTLDKVLAPYGLQWQAPEPKGTLADAQKRLTTANNMLQSASDARAEYEQGEKSLLDAIDKQATLPVLSDPSKPAVGTSGGPTREQINLQGKAEHAEVTQLFINAALHTARGNKATIDQMVGTTELELAGAKPGSPEYAEIKGRLDGLKKLQAPAASQVTLAEAYAEFGVAQKNAADLAVKAEPIKQALVARAMQRNPHHFDWDGYTNAAGEYTGKLKSQKVIEENGQLYLVNTYENDVFLDDNNNDTPVLKYALTYDRGDKNIRDDFRNDPLNKQWQQLLASTQSSASAPVCTPHGTGSQSALAAAKSKIIGVQVEQFDAQLQDAKTKLVDATTARDKAITEHGGGTVEAPAGTLKPGEKPVKITVNGHDLWVAPEVAAAYEKDGPGAIGASGKSVRIEMGGQWLWVHPEVAAAEIDRASAETEKNRLETWQHDVRPAMVAARDWYGFYASNPKLLTDGNEEHEARLKDTYFKEHKDQALASYQVELKQLYDNGFTGDYKQYKPGELSSTVARALGLDQSSEGVAKVTGEITDRAGENAEVKVVPIFSLDGGMESSTALFAIKSDGKEIGYVDSSGKYYGSFDEFQHENRIFSDKSKLILAKDGDMKLGADGFSLDEVEVADGRKVDFWDKATDIGLGIVAGAATIVSFVPGGQWAIPIAITSGAALGGKTLYKEGEHLLQGGDFDSQSAWNIATGVTAFLPVGAGALRTFGLARAGLSTSEAFAGGFGMARMSDASWGIGKLRVNVTQSSYAEQAASYLQSGSRLNTVAWGLDAGGVVTGVPVLARSAEDLAQHGGEMSFAELANAILGIGTGAVGTGLGGRSLLNNMPGAAGPRGGDGTPASGFPPPDPTGQRALPAGESEGRNPPPPTGDKGDPSGDGQPSRPMVLHELGPDGVYHPTDKLVFHDPDHPVIPGELIKTGEAGDDPTMPLGRDLDGSAERSSPIPADGDPIIVLSSEPTVTDGPVRLIWDPETRSFTGMPERDTSGYVYTSGKDPKTPSAYLDGLTTEQLVTRYEQEKGYYSSRELAERYGPNGIPETLRSTVDESAAPGGEPPAGGKPAKQRNWGDFRISALGRVRFNSDPINLAVHSIPGVPEAFQLGNPTWRSYMVGFGTRTSYRALWQSFADSIKYRSLEPVRYIFGKELGISIRPNEHRNITLAQLGLKVQRQTAFQFKGEDLLDAAHRGLFGDGSDSVFTVMPRSARVEGPAGNKGWAVELTFSLALRSKSAILSDGESDFFRQTADGKTEFYEFDGDVPYRKVYLEDKYYLTSLLSIEKRYEVAMNATLPEGTVVNSEFVDANKGVLDRLRLRAQFVVKDKQTAEALADNPDMSTIRGLVESGEIDAQKSILFIPGSKSGMRQSAVPGLALGETIVDLTGRSRRVWNAGASRLEVIVNEAFHKFLPSPDRILLRKLPAPYNHYVRSGGPIYINLFGKREAVASTLDVTIALRSPALKFRVPSVPFLQFPLAFTGEIRFFYRTNLPDVAPIVAKADFVRREFTFDDKLPVEIAVPRWLHELDQRADKGGGLAFPRGGRASLTKWLDEIETTATPSQKAEIEAFRQSTLLSLEDEAFIPPGAMSAVRDFLATQAKPTEMPPPEFIYLAPSDQQQSLARWYSENGVTASPPARPLAFRRPVPAAAGAANAASARQPASAETGTAAEVGQPRTLQLEDESGNVITAAVLGTEPKSAENVYVPPADGPQARGDEPELVHKSHILFRDPETGEAYVLPWIRGASEDHVPGGQGQPQGEPPDARPVPKAIEAAPPTTYSLQQVRNMRQPEKWKAGEVYTRELNGSPGEAHFPIEANPNGPYPVVGQGGRYVDSPVFKSQDEIEAIEVKTYHRWTTINGAAQMREVPLTPKLQEQINKDVALRNGNSGYQPRWVFLDAPPSAELQRALDDARIIGNIFGHNTPAATARRPQSATTEAAPGKTLRLEDESGKVIIAAMLGTEPRGPEQVYVPPSDGPRAPADAPEVADKTHILVYDSNTGEAVVLPWIRGASANHALTRDGVRATPLDQVPDLVMGDFQPNQIPWLKREQVAELTEQQFRDMDQAGLLPYLTKSQLRGIPKAKIRYVNIAGLDGKQVPWLTEGHIRNLTNQQFQDLGKAGLTPHLTKPQVQAIKGDKVKFVDMSTLEARQVPWFKPSQVEKFTSQQFEDLGEAGLLKNLGERQVQAIPETMIGSLDVAKLDPKQVPWLTEKQIPVLTRDQWGAFTIHHIEALTQKQIEAVTPKQFEEMSPGQFRKFTPEQFEWMSGDQTNALSVLQLTTFRATHKKAMTPDQAASVDLALSHARMRENAQALATFGGMSTTSYVLWSSLPPTWTATAGAVAFGVRGFVFGAQAIFPNATANHKPFGRFLNALGGATFIAAAPGAATGMIQGKDIVVNSTFSLGNVVYGTKSMLQSFTGRPVIRNLAEYLAGPGYVLGCAVYTLHSWPAPIATVAGTMFTFGCAEFWASAYRTDQMNRRSVPRTDADIAAAQKSDKRWAALDRWTLGITFGIGMLLFSLDSLLAEPWKGAATTPPADPKKPDGDGDASSQQPDDPSDGPGEPKTPPEDLPQLVVSADEGLNLRAQPDEDSAVVTVLQPGTFVEQTAKPATDPSGEAWIPVEGFGPDGKMHRGWVSGDYVEVHPEGRSNPEGRTNPTLEKDGYQWVEVKDGDSIRLIAKTHSADVAETVVLNMDHILSPDMIFSGDRIYLPAASIG